MKAAICLLTSIFKKQKKSRQQLIDERDHYKARVESLTQELEAINQNEHIKSRLTGANRYVKKNTTIH